MEGRCSGRGVGSVPGGSAALAQKAMASRRQRCSEEAEPCGEFGKLMQHPVALALASV